MRRGGGGGGGADHGNYNNYEILIFLMDGLPQLALFRYGGKELLERKSSRLHQLALVA